MFMSLVRKFNIVRCSVCLVVFILLLTLCSCAVSDNTEQSDEATGAENSESNTTIIEENENMPKLKLRINGIDFTATLYDTQTTRALLEKLPMTLTMEELNGNEKYNYLPFDLPISSESVGNIKTGDIMLWGDNCLVLFYEDFSTSYRYTKIGYIENPAEFPSTVGTDDVTVEIKIEK